MNGEYKDGGSLSNGIGPFLTCLRYPLSSGHKVLVRKPHLAEAILEGPTPPKAIAFIEAAIVASIRLISFVTQEAHVAAFSPI